ncbi:MAG: acyltransferase family protein, partial [Planctomycetota bacterium]
MSENSVKVNLHAIPVKDFLDAGNMARAVAIMLIILAHVKFADSFWMSYASVTSAGKLGVSIFVFYSGLLNEFKAKTAGIHFCTRTWIKKRMLRIYPVYWIGLLLTIMVGVIVKLKYYGPLTILTNFTGIPLLVKQPIVSSGYARPFWFVSFILLCYLLFILLRNVKQKGYLAIGSMIFSLLA